MEVAVEADARLRKSDRIFASAKARSLISPFLTDNVITFDF